jgi:hypothetical protein
MGINDKLKNIQMVLRAPKTSFNGFGSFNYRSAEDILEAVKPILKDNNCTLRLTDAIEQIGTHYYIKAAAILTDIESGEAIENYAFAREEETKKGYDAAQITGSASSYARKYALNGLFCIDDSKLEPVADPDTNAAQVISQQQTGAEPKQEKKATDKQIAAIRAIAKEQGKELDEAIVKGWTSKQASDFIAKYKGGK